MLPMESRSASRNGRDRRKPALAALESLEKRELMAYSPLGTSLPDLTVSGFASTVASWGGNVTVTANLQNLGAATYPDPLPLATGAAPQASAPASTVEVYAVRSRRSLKGAVDIGPISFPALDQNTEVQLTQTLTLPSRPKGFAGDGGKIYLVLKANGSGSVIESDTTNNVSKPIPVQIEAPLPELAVVGLDVPPTMQPGDTIQPNIRIANLGPADTLAQGPVTVELVASTTPTFNSGSTVIASYSVSDIPGAESVSSQSPVVGDANLTPNGNIVTIEGNPVTLPTSPNIYYIGVVVDPSNQIKQLSKVPQFTRPKNPFSLAHVVGPRINGLPPAGVVTPGGTANVPLFPNPVGGIFIGVPPGSSA